MVCELNRCWLNPFGVDTTEKAQSVRSGSFRLETDSNYTDILAFHSSGLPLPELNSSECWCTASTKTFSTVPVKSAIWKERRPTTALLTKTGHRPGAHQVHRSVTGHQLQTLPSSRACAYSVSGADLSHLEATSERLVNRETFAQPSCRRYYAGCFLGIRRHRSDAHDVSIYRMGRCLGK